MGVCPTACSSRLETPALLVCVALFGCARPDSNERGSTSQAFREVHRASTVVRGDKIVHIFELRNASGCDLRLADAANKSCGCVSADVQSPLWRAEGIASISVSIDTQKRSGLLRESIDLSWMSDGGHAVSATLVVEVDVQEGLSAEPPSIVFSPECDGAGKRIRIRSPLPVDWLSFQCLSSSESFRIRPVEIAASRIESSDVADSDVADSGTEGSELLCEVTYVGDVASGNSLQEELVCAVATLPGREGVARELRLSVPCSRNLQSGVSVSPSLVVAPFDPAQQRGSANLLIQGRLVPELLDKGFHVECDGFSVTHAVNTRSNRHIHTALTFRAVAPSVPVRSSLRLYAGNSPLCLAESPVMFVNRNGLEAGITE
jgi:hypothetical protein